MGESKTTSDKLITHQDLAELGDVDTALSKFYEEAIAAVVQETEVTEPILRRWFNEQLITEAGTRGLVYQGDQETGGLPNLAVRLLEEQFIIRAENRAGSTWYELVHDRFVEPILQANQLWQLQRSEQSPLIKAAQSWGDHGRVEDKLLQGELLAQALVQVEAKSYEPYVVEFVEASQKAHQARALQTANAQARQRGFIVVVLLLAFLFSVGMTIFALQQRQQAIANEQVALAEAATAEFYKQRSAANAARALTREAEALAAQQTALAEAATAEAYRKQAEEDRATLRENLGTQEAFLQAMLREQTATAQALADRATNTPFYLDDPVTGTPLPRPTPMPTVTNMIVEQLTQVQATQSALEKRSPVAQPDSELSCPVEPQGEFADLWQAYQTELGCPRQAAPTQYGLRVRQPFEAGFMFWAEQQPEDVNPPQNLDLLLVVITDEPSWWGAMHDPDWADYFVRDSSACADQFVDVSAINVLGAAWCSDPQLQAELGQPTAAEEAVGGLVQEFEGGFILRDTDQGPPYLLFWEGRRVVR